MLPPDYYDYIKPLLFKVAPETAHNIALSVLKRSWLPRLPDIDDDRLGVCCGGLAFRSPIGLAAGFDKNAAAFTQCFRHGFSFAEVGTLTLKPQSGNPKPRMFRLAEDRAIINRLGFNNQGVEVGLANIVAGEEGRYGILGINIGKNKDTEEALDDYIPLINEVYGLADYITINISSPNTQDLRKLQTKDYFSSFIKAIMAERNGIAAYNHVARPVFVKISPDMHAEDLEGVLDSVLAYKVDGLIVSNTTVARPDSLQSMSAKEGGGLSGAPLTEQAETLMTHIYKEVENNIPLIGVGGIMNGQDAVRRIRAGATLVQLYSGLVYRGMGLVQDAKRALLSEIEKEGVGNIEGLIGIGN